MIGLVHQPLQDGSLEPLMEPGGETSSGQDLAFSQVVGVRILPGLDESSRINNRVGDDAI